MVHTENKCQKMPLRLNHEERGGGEEGPSPAGQRVRARREPLSSPHEWSLLHGSAGIRRERGGGEGASHPREENGRGSLRLTQRASTRTCLHLTQRQRGRDLFAPTQRQWKWASVQEISEESVCRGESERERERDGESEEGASLPHIGKSGSGPLCFHTNSHSRRYPLRLIQTERGRCLFDPHEKAEGPSLVHTTREHQKMPLCLIQWKKNPLCLIHIEPRFCVPWHHMWNSRAFCVP